jgi:hypothetical protein
MLTNWYLSHQLAVTIGMYNSCWGELKHVKTLLDKGLVSIDDKDAVSSLAVVQELAFFWRSLLSHSPVWPHYAGLRDHCEEQRTNLVRTEWNHNISAILFVPA